MYLIKYFKLKSDEELNKIHSNIKVEANENKFVLTLFLTNITFKENNNELKVYCNNIVTYIK